MLFGFLAGSLALFVFAAPAQAGSSASDCVSIDSAALSTGLSFDVRNGCAKRLSCALTAKQEAKFVVGASDTHQLTGSSATCKDSWKIDDVAWECK